MDKDEIIVVHACARLHLTDEGRLETRYSLRRYQKSLCSMCGPMYKTSYDFRILASEFEDRRLEIMKENNK